MMTKYRILCEGEIVDDGDQVDISDRADDDSVWVLATNIGEKIPDPSRLDNRIYRRRVDSTAVPLDGERP